MKGDVEPAASGAISRPAGIYQSITGESIFAWMLVAALNIATQIVFYRYMSPTAGYADDEFGAFNSALGIVGLMTLPLLALHRAFRLFPISDVLRENSVVILETFAWAWGICSIVLILLPLPVPHQPRFSLQMITLLNILLGLGAILSSAMYGDVKMRRRWTVLVIGAVITRLVIGTGVVGFYPAAEAGLTAFLIAGLVTLTPALRLSEVDFTARIQACSKLLDRDFLLFAGATLSTLLGIYLFTNADRIAALQWYKLHATTLGMRGHSEFDNYQAAGLCARALLWGTQPILWILYAQRSKLNKSTAAVMNYFWVYLAVLLTGAFVLGFLMHRPRSIELSHISDFGPTFAAVMVPLGLLQGLGIFLLASRRYPECFVLGGCAVIYALTLAWFGRRPDIMLQYMFGLALISTMLVMFVGVIRWGRKQP